MKKFLTACVLALACGFAAAAPAQEAAGEEKRRDIRRLLQTLGAGELGVQMIQQMLPELRTIMTALLEGYPEAQRRAAIGIMEEEMLKTFTAERMVEEVVPLYDRHLDGEEVKALLAFFESPAGRKYISAQPLILREAMGLSDKLVDESWVRVEQRLRERGLSVMLNRPPQPPPRPAPRRGRRRR